MAAADARDVAKIDSHHGVITPQHRRPGGRLFSLYLIITIVAARVSLAAVDTNDLTLPTLPEWIRLYALRTSVGYKDNVLLSAQPRGSAFASAGGEFLLVRLPGSSVDAQLFFSADRTHFLASDVPDSETTLSAVGKISKKTGQATASLSASYLFQDQVLDVGSTDPELNTIRVRVHDMALKPALRYDLPRRWFVEMEPAGRRQEFASPLDDIWEASAKTIVGRGYGFGSRVTVSAQGLERFYDEKTQRTRAGESLPGTSLRMHRVVADAAVDHYWDAKRVWRTQGRIGFSRNDDNGTGYFDYDRWFALAQVRYKRGPWELRTQVRFDDYIYRHQTVSATDSGRRREHEITIGARAERKLNKITTVFLQYDGMLSQSSRAADEYDAQTLSAGAQWDF